MRIDDRNHGMKTLKEICWISLLILMMCEISTETVWGKSLKNKNLQKYPELENQEKQNKQENGPPPWAPAHGYRRKFLYYSHHHVYYDPTARKYFWLDAGVVKVGIKLPDWIHLSGSGLGVELPHQSPIFSDFN